MISRASPLIRTEELFSEESDGAKVGAAQPSPALWSETRLRRTVRPQTSKAKRRLQLFCALLVLDVCAITLSFLLADLIRFGDPFAPAGVNLVVVLLPVFIPLAFSNQAYTLSVLDAPRQGIFHAAKAFLIAAAAVLGILFYFKATGDVSRIVFGLGVLTSIGALATFRYIFGQWAGSHFHWNFVNEVVFLDGVSFLPIRGQILLFADQLGLTPSANDPETLGRIGRLLAQSDRVILAAPPERRSQWVRILRGSGVDVQVLTPELDHLGGLRMTQVGNRSAIVVATGPMSLQKRLLKRAFDLAIVIPALLALSPVLLMIALAVKFDSPGPIFFRQDRVGRANCLFCLLKFRSMRVEVSDLSGTRSASRDDDRVTRLGKFIRATSLDELPQLINVLKGEMSIVGPRPHALASTADESLFWEVDPRYWERGAVKPGITGLAQVRGHRGATATRADLTNRVQADLEYLDGWSIWRDVLIILRTAKVMVHKNAF